MGLPSFRVRSFEDLFTGKTVLFVCLFASFFFWGGGFRIHYFEGLSKLSLFGVAQFQGSSFLRAYLREKPFCLCVCLLFFSFFLFFLGGGFRIHYFECLSKLSLFGVAQFQGSSFFEGLLREKHCQECPWLGGFYFSMVDPNKGNAWE